MKNFIKIKIVLFAYVVLAFQFSCIVYSQENLIKEKIRIGIHDFIFEEEDNLKTASSFYATFISKNLLSTGCFEIVKPSFSLPVKFNSLVKVDDWKQQGVNVVLRGGLKKHSDNRAGASFRLFDLSDGFSSEVGKGKQYIHLNSMFTRRGVAEIIADQVFSRLIKEGIPKRKNEISERIAYWNDIMERRESSSVKRLQEFLLVKADGKVGPATLARFKQWEELQRSRISKIDGITGQKFDCFGTSSMTKVKTTDKERLGSTLPTKEKTPGKGRPKRQKFD